MKTWARILICLAVAIVIVPVMILSLHATIGRTSNALVGLVGMIAVFATWYLTGLKKRA